MPRKKILIVGGGVAGCTAAYTLATHNKLKDDYDVTLFQMGWKLGGKGASGRNFDLEDGSERNEEHGPHIWFGAYTNAWKMMDDIYERFLPENGGKHGIFESLRTPERTPIFKPSNQVGLCSKEDKSAFLWQVNYPELTPQDKKESPLALLVSLITHNFERIQDAYDKFQEKSHKIEIELPLNNKELGEFLRQEGETSLNSLKDLLSIKQNDIKENFSDRETLIKAIRDLSALVHDAVKETIIDYGNYSDLRPESKRELKIFSLADYLLTGLRIYFHKDNYDIFITQGLDAKTDNGDYYFDGEYLTKHAEFAHFKILDDSDLLRAAYDSFYAFIQDENGKFQPSLGAASGLRGLLWLFFQYDKHVTYRMQAGMGEVVFSPIYELLKKQGENRAGVDFKFFHKVTDIELNDNDEVTKIHFKKQADVLSETRSYNPIQSTSHVENENQYPMKCWRNSPDYDQLTPDSRLEDIHRGNETVPDPGFESQWSLGNSVEKNDYVTIGDSANGDDFDEVIMAVPVDTLSIIGGSLKSRSEVVNQACLNLETIQTTACQLWVKSPSPNAGPTPDGYLGDHTYFESPLAIAGADGDWDIWVDYSDVLKLENHSKDSHIHYALYGTGVLPRDFKDLNYDEPFYPSDKQNEAVANLTTWLNETGYKIWPPLKHGSKFNMDLLESADLGAKPYVRVNINPSDLYTTSAANTLQFRFTNEEHYIGNVHFAGDWMYTHINLGCVEAAVISGLKAVESLTDSKLNIIYPKEKFNYE